MRLVKTLAENLRSGSELAYPKPEDPLGTFTNVYPFVFEGGAISAAQGYQDPGWTNRSEYTHGYACHVPGGYLWEGSIVQVFGYRGCWWTTCPSAELWGTLDGDLIPGGTALLSVCRRSGGSYADTGWNLTVHAPPVLTAETVIAGKWALAGWDPSPGERRWVIKMAEC
jgi:hypothetical protein